MKQFYLIFISFLTIALTQAQIVNIPDANFKNALVNTNCIDTNNDNFADSDADINNDGEIQVSEAEAITFLNVFNNSISSLEGIDAFINLQTLYCSGNQITTLDVSSLNNLVTLLCNNSQITSLNLDGLNNLETLHCYSNDLTTLDISGLMSIETLWCFDNQLLSLDASGLTSMTELRCYDNQLTTLFVDGMVDLTTLRCFNNQITELDLSGLTNLVELRCEINQLTSLTLPDLINLDTLKCFDNELTILDISGLTNLTSVQCGFNMLTTLVIGNLTNLVSLDCNQNQLSDLDLSALPNLEVLRCSNNLISEFDVNDLLNLNSLTCYGNQLSTIDVGSLSNLNQLRCYDNQLSSLFIKNGIEFNVLQFQDNPNLEYICVDDINFSTVQASVLFNNLDCTINSYCSFEPGGEFFTVTGENKIDFDNDGCDIDDLVFPNLKINVTDGTIYGSVITSALGDYSIPVQAGTHILTPILENPSYFNISPSTITIDFPTEISPYTQDFCLTAIGAFNDLEINIIPLENARPGFNAQYRIIFKNKGNTTLSGSVNLVFSDDLMNFAFANPSIDGQSVNNLNWNFSNLQPFGIRTIDFTMDLNTPTDSNFPLNGDDILIFHATVNGTASDQSPEDNMFTLNQTVVNSFDPNDKTCLEGNTITPEMVGEYVHYVIRFENTGTADAINVVVKDVIDTSKFDVTKLIPVHSSHEVVTRIKNTNEIEFIFENINLPFDDANNDGYVAFKIKTLASLVVGDTFSNDAEIYFDYNAPIVTNDYLTTIQEPLSIGDVTLGIFKTYPNPVNNVLFVESESKIKSVTIYDVNGRLLSTLALTRNDFKQNIDMSNLLKGIYFVNLKSEDGQQTLKVIKE